MKVSFIFGTRPEAVKLAPVILAMEDDPDLHPHVCVTGQHQSMLDQILRTFDIEPHENLQLMQQNQSLASFTSRALAAVDGYLSVEQPDLVLVQGDTSTVLCAALAAFYRQIPVGHIEAGLRTGNRYSPFPEEMNRVLASQIADYHFAPTANARTNLLNAGVDPHKITVTGNTIVDALQLADKLIQDRAQMIEGLPAELMTSKSQKRMVLITGHRRENFGEDFENICQAISELSRTYRDVEFVYPVHLNPNVHGPAHRILGDHDNVHLLEPLAYLPFVALMARSTLVLTDSGGIQEEAPSLRKPVLVMRDNTERPEGIQAGTAKLVGTSQTGIVSAVTTLLDDNTARKRMTQATNPYGDGRASQRIINVLREVAAKKLQLCGG